MKKIRTTSKPKKIKKLKINKNYSSMEHYRATMAHIKIDRLTYGIIDGHEAEYIEINGETIELKESWKELILFMIANVIENYPTDFIHILGKHDVVSQSLTVSKSYGKVSFDRNKQFEVYKLYNTDYYVEAIFDISTIFRVVCGLLEICVTTDDEIRIGIVSKKYIEKKINFDLLEENESIAGPQAITLMKKLDMQLVEIEVLGDRVGVQGINGVLWVFCSEIFKKFGDEGLKKLPKYKSTGISKTNTRDDVNYMQLRDSELFMYTDLNPNGIAKFIEDSIIKLDIEGQVKLKFRKIKK